MTRLILLTSITPNTITILGILFAFISSYLIIESYLFLASLLIFITILIDFSDGEVSRYRNQSSLEGVYLDKVYDFSIRPILVSGIAIYNIIEHQNICSYIAGFIFVISALLYPLVVEYAKTITINESILKNLDKENYKLESNRIPIRHKEGIIKTNLKKILSFYDFPNVFFLLIIVLVTTSYVMNFTSLKFDIINAYVTFYSITYPLIIIFFIFNNVKHKKIENEFISKHKTNISRL